MNGIQKAIAKAGGTPALLAELVGNGCTRQNVEYWVNVGRVGPGWVIQVYDVTGVAVHELNSEVFPRGRVMVQ
jgi:hypothetical protein